MAWPTPGADADLDAIELLTAEMRSQLARIDALVAACRQHDETAGGAFPDAAAHEQAVARAKTNADAARDQLEAASDELEHQI